MSYDTQEVFILLGQGIGGSPDHWWVTTIMYSNLSSSDIEGSPDHWWVTTGLTRVVNDSPSIEGSPDHWWVTTKFFFIIHTVIKLKGHQIIGELRRCTDCCNVKLKLKGHQIIGELWHLCLVEPPLVHTLKGHQIIGELRLSGFYDCVSAKDWRVTRSLVSYDNNELFFIIGGKLKGHQIIGELRRSKIMKGAKAPFNWRVTRSLVSYDLFLLLGSQND